MSTATLYTGISKRANMSIFNFRLAEDLMYFILLLNLITHFIKIKPIRMQLIIRDSFNMLNKAVSYSIKGIKSTGQSM